MLSLGKTRRLIGSLAQEVERERTLILICMAFAREFQALVGIRSSCLTVRLCLAGSFVSALRSERRTRDFTRKGTQTPRTRSGSSVPAELAGTILLVCLLISRTPLSPKA